MEALGRCALRRGIWVLFGLMGSGETGAVLCGARPDSLGLNHKPHLWFSGDAQTPGDGRLSAGWDFACRGSAGAHNGAYGSNGSHHRRWRTGASPAATAGWSGSGGSPPPGTVGSVGAARAVMHETGTHWIPPRCPRPWTPWSLPGPPWLSQPRAAPCAGAREKRLVWSPGGLVPIVPCAAVIFDCGCDFSARRRGDGAHGRRRRRRSSPLRFAVMAVLALWAVLDGVGRVYLGVQSLGHDVVAGWLLGLLLTVLAVGLFARSDGRSLPARPSGGPSHRQAGPNQKGPEDHRLTRKVVPREPATARLVILTVATPADLAVASAGSRGLGESDRREWLGAQRRTLHGPGTTARWGARPIDGTGPVGRPHRRSRLCLTTPRPGRCPGSTVWDWPSPPSWASTRPWRVDRRRRLLHTVRLPHHAGAAPGAPGDRPDRPRGLLPAAGRAIAPRPARRHVQHGPGSADPALRQRGRAAGHLRVVVLGGPGVAQDVRRGQERGSPGHP